MSTDLTLHQRRRCPTADELAGIPWLSHLSDEERTRVTPDLVVGDALPGDHVCRYGRAPTYWFGVVDGLLKMSTDGAAAAPKASQTAVSSGRSTGSPRTMSTMKVAVMT